METVLAKVVSRASKRKGRGYSSGKGGHTTGRGQKGQKARGKVSLLFEGIKMKKSLIKRLPLKRGRGKLKHGDKPLVVKLALLNLLPSGSLVDVNLLIREKIVDKDDALRFGVKVLGDGEVNKKLKVSLPISKSAAKKIEKAGGEIVKNAK